MLFKNNNLRMRARLDSRLRTQNRISTNITTFCQDCSFVLEYITAQTKTIETDWNWRPTVHSLARSVPKFRVLTSIDVKNNVMISMKWKFD
jgi:hypothetical protein